MAFSGGESQIFKNISANTSQFALEGGRYVLAAIATWSSGSIALQMLAADGSTYLSPKDIGGSANTLSANGTQTIDCPAGQYRITVTGSPTVIYATVARVQV